MKPEIYKSLKKFTASKNILYYMINAILMQNSCISKNSDAINALACILLKCNDLNSYFCIFYSRKILILFMRRIMYVPQLCMLSYMSSCWLLKKYYVHEIWWILKDFGSWKSFTGEPPHHNNIKRFRILYFWLFFTIVFLSHVNGGKFINL